LFVAKTNKPGHKDVLSGWPDTRHHKDCDDMTRARTGDQALIREINLSIILNALRDHSPLSRAALAVGTGLNKTTVSSLVQQLLDAQLVTESGVGKNITGRPGILLQLNALAGGMIGVEIGVDFISVLLTDFAAHVVWRHQERTDRRDSQSVILHRAFTNIEAAAKQAQHIGLPVLGMAMGVPGLVDTQSGTLLYAPNLNWENVPLRQMLRSRFDFPVTVDNEATMAAFGESYFGVARGSRNVLYVSAGVGIGGGLVLDGRIYPGSAGFAGEVGHMTIEPNGLTCNCGNRGCWETLASQSAVFRRVHEAIAAGATSSLSRFKNGKRESLTIPLIVRAAEEGDVVALQALTETGMYLGIGLASLINILNPEMVVFGGILSLAKEFLMPVIQETIQARAMRWSSRSAQIVVAAYGSDACVMGAVAMIYDQILRQPFKSLRALA
jgi:glucokinase-like ROK family protein